MYMDVVAEETVVSASGAPCIWGLLYGRAQFDIIEYAPHRGVFFPPRKLVGSKCGKTGN